jgi:tetratricopeptide (TPR) repeat protein
LLALAILERATPEALAAVAGGPVVGEAWAAVRDHPAVTGDETGVTIEADTAARLLKALEQEDVPAYRRLHERAVAYLARRVAKEEAAAGPLLLATFERLAERLISDDPPALLSLVGALQPLPWPVAYGPQLCLFYEGVALRRTEQYQAAIERFDRLLAATDLDERLRGRAFNSRANCFLYLGQPERAYDGYRASLALLRATGSAENRFSEGKVLLNMGVLAYELRHYPEAMAHLTEAQASFAASGEGSWLAIVQNELGLVYRDQGRWQEALACFEAFVTRRRADGAWNNVALGLLNQGEVYLFLGHLNKAEEALNEALHFMQTRTYQVDIYLHLGLVFQVQERLAEAEEAFRAALTLAEAIGRRDNLPHLQYHLGAVLQRRGKPEKAQEQYEAAAREIEAAHTAVHNEAIKISLLGRWQQVYEALVLHCLELGEPAAAFAWAERARARAFADALAPGTSIAPTATLAGVQAVLAADTALLYYFTTGVLEWDMPLLQAIPAANPLRQHLLLPGRTLLFVITRTGLVVHDCALDPNRLASQGTQHSTINRWLAPAVLERLYHTLLARAGDLAAYPRLVIVPHGPLHQVPFAALWPPAAALPVLTYSPSATVYHHGRQRHSGLAGERCLAIGYRGEGTHALPLAEAEATLVARLLGGRSWVDQGPKKAHLAQLAAGYRWLHFACHGWFNTADPLASYLETGSGERLTAREVLESWQIRADLVTLSACETGISTVLRGDEPMGLVRAFLAAGAGAVLVSRWAVDDLATCLLMYRFYALWEKTSGEPGRALAQAQQWLRELSIAGAQTALQLMGLAELVEVDRRWALPPTARPFAHPRDWAGFTLVGNERLGQGDLQAEVWERS